MYVLAIETSCDETSVAIVKDGKEVIESIVLSQIDIHKNYGGVVPEIASRNHIENITIVLEELFYKAKMNMDDIDIIGVTYGPGLSGALLIGLEAAKTLAWIHNKPLIPVHHIAGHIYANNVEKELEFPLIALVVSGGHTELVLMKEHYSFEKLGGTLDDAVGEAYDKVARVLGFPYPGGPYIDSASRKGENTYTLPLPLDDLSYNFSFSGIKSAVINLVHNEKTKGNEIRVDDLACSFQSQVITILLKKTLRVLKNYNISNLVIAGGVAANNSLREQLEALCQENSINFSCPVKENCTDNAVMIGVAAYAAYKKGIQSDLKLSIKSSDYLH